MWDSKERSNLQTVKKKLKTLKVMTAVDIYEID